METQAREESTLGESGELHRGCKKVPFGEKGKLRTESCLCRGWGPEGACLFWLENHGRCLLVQWFGSDYESTSLSFQKLQLPLWTMGSLP